MRIYLTPFILNEFRQINSTVKGCTLDVKECIKQNCCVKVLFSMRIKLPPSLFLSQHFYLKCIEENTLMTSPGYAIFPVCPFHQPVQLSPLPWDWRQRDKYFGSWNLPPLATLLQIQSKNKKQTDKQRQQKTKTKNIRYISNLPINN